MVDAAVDAGAALDEDDACAIQSAYVYQPIVGYEGNGMFDLAASPNPINTGTNPSYVSFDLTGLLFGCINSPCNQAGDQVVFSTDAAPPNNVSAISCVTGYNAVAELLPSGDTGHCLTDGGRANEGVHLHATGLSNWGLNLGIDLRQNCYAQSMTFADYPYIDGGTPGQPCYYDASPWTGISFWARLGSTDSATNAILTIGDPDTAGVLGGTYPFNALLCGDAPCVADAGPPTVHGPQQCDPFGKAITFGSQWQFYRVPFNDMTQKGYGLPEPKPDLAHFLQVKLNLSRGQLGSSDYDVWINDISFYK